ncbi:hypothetical protein B0H13DRAFT_2378170 [Mycena leptocephala]|nr:hypothetical protein B0H13DRAFT_2378170 [Mycena leptocephala]
MEDFITTAFGDHLLPIWSLRQDTWFCSLGAPPNAIPLLAVSHMTPLIDLLDPITSVETLRALDYTKAPVWFNAKEHWLSWIPTEPTSVLFEDPIGYLFDERPVDTVDEYTDFYGSGSDDGMPNEPSRILAGIRLSQEWTNIATTTASRLHEICMTLTASSDFYCRNRWTGDLADVPQKMDVTEVLVIHFTEEKAQEAVTVVDMSKIGISMEDRQYIHSLRLDERAKTGVLYYLDRDYQNTTFSHLLKHNVPIHYAYTNTEKGNWRYLRLSPEVWNEFSTVSEKKRNSEVLLEDLPSYEEWKTDWNRSD